MVAARFTFPPPVVECDKCDDLQDEIEDLRITLEWVNGQHMWDLILCATFCGGFGLLTGLAIGAIW